jgi:hypothetical protein
MIEGLAPGVDAKVIAVDEVRVAGPFTPVRKVERLSMKTHQKIAVRIADHIGSRASRLIERSSECQI